MIDYTLARTIAFVRSDGRVCPNPGHWIRFWEQLRNFEPRLPQGLQPLILSGWNSPDYEKSQRLLEQIACASYYGLDDIVEPGLSGISLKDWHVSHCHRQWKPSSFPEFVTSDGILHCLDADNENLLVSYIDRSITDGICTRLKSHCCGNVAFKQGLDVIYARLAGTIGIGLSPRAATELVTALSSLEENSPLNCERGREAVCVCFYHLWRSLGEATFDALVAPAMQNTWAGSLLAEMRVHSAKKNMRSGKSLK
jgi:hypothetical protein